MNCRETATARYIPSGPAQPGQIWSCARKLGNATSFTGSAGMWREIPGTEVRGAVPRLDSIGGSKWTFGAAVKLAESTALDGRAGARTQLQLYTVQVTQSGTAAVPWPRPSREGRPRAGQRRRTEQEVWNVTASPALPPRTTTGGGTGSNLQSLQYDV